MAEKGNSELLRQVVAKTRQYRRLMQELGFGQAETLLSLARVMGLEVPSPASGLQLTPEKLLESLTHLLAPAPTSRRPSHPLTLLLVSLETAISQLRDEDSEDEDVPEGPPARQAERKERAKKKNNEKKKGKKAGKVKALQEIQSKALADSLCEQAELVQNLKKIEQLKELLERKVLLDLCQQSMLQLASLPVYA